MKKFSIFDLVVKLFSYMMIGLIILVIFLASRPYWQAKHIEIGMTKTEILTIHQNRRIKTFTNLNDFCSNNISGWFSNACQFNQTHQAKYFLMVNIGIDTLQIIGFDNNDKVIFEMMGET